MFGRGTYTADGIKAIADSIAVTASLTSIDLSRNNLRDEGAKALAPALRDSTSLTYLWYKLRTQTPKLASRGGAIACRWSECKWAVRWRVLRPTRVLSGECVEEM